MLWNPLITLFKSPLTIHSHVDKSMLLVSNWKLSLRPLLEVEVVIECHHWKLSMRPLLEVEAVIECHHWKLSLRPSLEVEVVIASHYWKLSLPLICHKGHYWKLDFFNCSKSALLEIVMKSKWLLKIRKVPPHTFFSLMKGSINGTCCKIH